MMDNSKHITQAIAGALEIMNEQPLTLNEFIDEVMSDYMDFNPCKAFRKHTRNIYDSHIYITSQKI